MPPRQRRQRSKPERDFQNGVIQMARASGWMVYHFHDSRREVVREDGSRQWIGDSDAAGWVDLALVRPPDVYLWELKAEGGHATPDQRKTGTALKDCPGVLYAEVRPSDWDWIETQLQRRPARSGLNAIVERVNAVLQRLKG